MLRHCDGLRQCAPCGLFRRTAIADGRSSACKKFVKKRSHLSSIAKRPGEQWVMKVMRTLSSPGQVLASVPRGCRAETSLLTKRERFGANSVRSFVTHLDTALVRSSLCAENETATRRARDARPLRSSAL